jgi:hypothetical protein
VAEAAGGDARHEVEVDLIRECISTQQVGGGGAREEDNARVSGEKLGLKKICSEHSPFDVHVTNKFILC